jgi:hypothetical protein
MRLLQIGHPQVGRRIALVDGNTLSVLKGFNTAYDAATAALATGVPFAQFLSALPVVTELSYDDWYTGKAHGKILTPFDHPEPARTLVSGTGLTHLASAETRQKMHIAGEQETDSMRMYRWGEEGGRPAPGQVGTSPEWFYKGSGLVLRAQDEPLTVHDFAEDGGEEPEIAGVYLIDEAGQPRRVGMAQGNEFSDHKTERRNYLYLAPSKLRQCSIGPELVVDPEFDLVPGTVKILRKGEVLWSKEISSGERRMSHSLANMEHHHFKYPQHRRPGDVHIHFYGAGAFSFGAGVELEDGDIAEIAFEGYGRPLRNPVQIEPGPEKLVAVRTA